MWGKSPLTRDQINPELFLKINKWSLNLSSWNRIWLWVLVEIIKYCLRSEICLKYFYWLHKTWLSLRRYRPQRLGVRSSWRSSMWWRGGWRWRWWWWWAGKRRWGLVLPLKNWRQVGIFCLEYFYVSESNGSRCTFKDFEHKN